MLSAKKLATLEISLRCADNPVLSRDRTEEAVCNVPPSLDQSRACKSMYTLGVPGAVLSCRLHERILHKNGHCMNERTYSYSFSVIVNSEEKKGRQRYHKKKRYSICIG